MPVYSKTSSSITTALSAGSSWDYGEDGGADAIGIVT
jgi:hypothetical protein